MNSLEQTVVFRNFAKKLFIVGNVYSKTIKAREDVHKQMQKMKKSIIRLNLSYSDVDRLNHKVEKLIELERRYSRFFKTPDTEVKELKDHIEYLENQLSLERKEKRQLLEEEEVKINQMKEHMNAVKNHAKQLLLDRERRNDRMKDLEKKISKRVDIKSYYTF
ncbi:MAG TPA: hypothetical protein VI564_04055 [Candidatus Nanoarchaeia archaeon]|nr:hypothetical protein [Candidatus Nanoarchaeia archaeon]